MILRPFVGDASEIMEMVAIGMRLRPAVEAWSPAAEGGAGETSRGRLWKLGSGLQALRAVEWEGAGEGEEG